MPRAHYRIRPPTIKQRPVLSCSIPGELHARLLQHCADTSTTVSTVVRQALQALPLFSPPTAAIRRACGIPSSSPSMRSISVDLAPTPVLMTSIAVHARRHRTHRFISVSHALDRYLRAQAQPTTTDPTPDLNTIQPTHPSSGPDPNTP